MNRNSLYIYIRMSTEMQANRGTSEDRQRKMAKEYARNYGYEYKTANEYKDLGVSGYLGENARSGQLGQFVKDVEKGKVASGSMLVVENLDRLSRAKPVEVTKLIQSLNSSGITITTLDDQKVITTESQDDFGNLIMQLMDSNRANMESKRRSELVEKGWEINRNKAIENKRPMTKHCPGWMSVEGLDKQTRKFELIKDRVQVVQQIYTWALNGYGYVRIAKKLNDACVPTFASGRTWHVSTVSKILNNRSVLGEFQPKKRDGKKQIIDESIGIIYGYFPQIITKEVFYQVQAAISKRSTQKGRKGKSYTNMFSGMTRCAKCFTPLNKIESKKLELQLEADADFMKLSFSERAEEFSKHAYKLTNMQFKSKGIKNKAYFYCANSQKESVCCSKGYPYEELETCVLSHLRNFDYSGILENIGSSDAIKLAGLKDKLIILKSEYELATSKVERIKRIIFDSDSEEVISEFESDMVDAIQKRNSISTELSSYEKTVKSLESKVQKEVDIIGNAKELVSKLEKIQSSGTETEISDLRTAIATRLRDVINYILLDAEIEFKDQANTTQQNRQFTICYIDGTFLTIIPDSKDPKNYKFINDKTMANKYQSNVNLII